MGGRQAGVVVKPARRDLQKKAAAAIEFFQYYHSGHDDERPLWLNVQTKLVHTFVDAIELLERQADERDKRDKRNGNELLRAWLQGMTDDDRERRVLDALSDFSGGAVCWRRDGGEDDEGALSSSGGAPVLESPTARRHGPECRRARRERPERRIAERGPDTIDRPGSAPNRRYHVRRGKVDRRAR